MFNIQAQQVCMVQTKENFDNVNKIDTIALKRMGVPKGSVLSFVHFEQSIINFPHYDGKVKKTPTMSK